jgi:hypothetical protein
MHTYCIFVETKTRNAKDVLCARWVIRFPSNFNLIPFLLGAHLKLYFCSSRLLLTAKWLSTMTSLVVIYWGLGRWKYGNCWKYVFSIPSAVWNLTNQSVYFTVCQYFPFTIKYILYVSFLVSSVCTNVDDSICGSKKTISISGDGFWLSPETYLLFMPILLFSFLFAISELLYIQSTTDVMSYECMVRLLMPLLYI